MADTDTYFQGQEMSHEIYYRDYNTPELQEKIQEKQKIHSQTSLNFNNHNNSSNQNAKSKLLKQTSPEKFKNQKSTLFPISNIPPQDIPNTNTSNNNTINNNSSAVFQKKQIDHQQQDLSQLLEEKDSHTCSHLWLTQNKLPPYVSQKCNRIWLGGFKKRQKSERVDDGYFTSKHIEKNINFQKPVYFQRYVNSPISLQPKKSCEQLRQQLIPADNFFIEKQDHLNFMAQQHLENIENPQQHCNNELKQIDYFFAPAAVPHDSRKKHGFKKQVVKVYHQENMWPSKYIPQSQKIRNRMNIKVSQQNLRKQQESQKEFVLDSIESVRQQPGQNYLNQESMLKNNHSSVHLRKSPSVYSNQSPSKPHSFKQNIGRDKASITNLSSMQQSSQLFRNQSQYDIENDYEKQSKKEFQRILGLNSQQISPNLQRKKKGKDHLMQEPKDIRLEYEEMHNFHKAKTHLQDYYSKVQ